jgi:cyclopropane fatty-acyl-phospholipid synthase-like methyltransferase
MHKSEGDINKTKIINYYNSIKDFFNKYCLKDLAIHNGYWDEKTISYEQSLERMVQILSDISELKKTDLVLDSGFGLGGSTIWIAERIGARVTGITIVKHQVDIARRVAKERKVDHLTTFKLMDFCKTNFEDATFDVVWALESAAYASNKLDFLRESCRILKSGGRIVIADGFIMKDRLTVRESSEMTWIEGLAIPNFSTVAQFKKHLKDLNFHNIRFRDISENVLNSAKIINEFAAQKYKELSSDQHTRNYKILEQHLRSLIAQLKPFEEHVWGYGIFSATR